MVWEEYDINLVDNYWIYQVRRDSVNNFVICLKIDVCMLFVD